MSTPSRPSDALALIVAQSLVDEGLVLKEKQGEIEEKLKAGSFSAEDWKLYVEIAIGKAENETTDAHANP